MRMAWILRTWLSALGLGGLCAHCSSGSSHSNPADSGGVDSPFESSGSGSDAQSGSEGGPAVSLSCGNLGGRTSDAGNCTPDAPVCCQTYTTSQCVPATAPCHALAWSCASTNDCPSGQICCIGLPNTTAGTVSCQPAPGCPAATVGSAQICKTDAECPNGGPCVTYICGGIAVLQMCVGTQAGSGVNQCNVLSDAGAEASATGDSSSGSD
jgi:hypothetical protein